MRGVADKLRDINSVGWDGVNASADQLTITNEENQLSLDIIFKKTFQTEDGKKVLEYLRKVTIEQPCWTPGADVSYGYAREGQNSIVREIEQRIRRANEPSR
ncbi:MAG: hypothetical protein CMI34_05355 [Opitutales bacterium]|nr:hypothetical protein [Opitutales bacterium]|tara:strand:+ start:285 stop:590 length:306 start_codon:yes stop_codon:yes gene_type:complete